MAKTNLVAGSEQNLTWKDDVSNDQIIRDLLKRNVTVERHLDPLRPDDVVYQAVWNNGFDPLEVHQLKSGSLREALTEAGGVSEWAQGKVDRFPKPASSSPTSVQTGGGLAPSVNTPTESAHMASLGAAVTGKPPGVQQEPTFPKQPAPALTTANVVGAGGPVNPGRPFPMDNPTTKPPGS